jgi:acyl-CoA thioesterase
MSDTSFASLLEAVDTTAGAATLDFPEDWLQGRAGFGGLVGALALKAMRDHVAAARKVRSLLISFVGPVEAGPFTVIPRVLRSGRAVSQVEVQVTQQDTVRCVVLGAFGGDRDSAIRVAPPSFPQMSLPEKGFELPYIEGLTPAFSRHFAYRWALGELPFSGGPGKEIGGWIQFRERTDCLSEEWLVALADAWPTPALSMLTTPAAASSMTWEMGFVHLDRRTCTLKDWWCFHSAVDSAEKGYVHERGAIWDPDGQLAAYSRQTAVVFG